MPPAAWDGITTCLRVTASTRASCFADVTFEVHPPTGSPEVILTEEVFIGEDDNGGGGSEAGLDAFATDDLTDIPQRFEAHPQQGWQ
jgi:hypothetical protein